MTRAAAIAAVAAVVVAMAVFFAVSRSDDPLWPIAAGIVGLVLIGVLAGIYVLDAAVRGARAAKDISRDDRAL